MTTRRGVESSREILKHFVSSVKTSLSSQSIRWWCQWKVANYLSRGVSDIGNTAPGLCGHYLLVLCQSIVHHASIHERINPSNLLHTMDVCSDTLEPRLHPNFIHLTFICKLKCKMLNGLAGQEKLYDAITPGWMWPGPWAITLSGWWAGDWAPPVWGHAVIISGISCCIIWLRLRVSESEQCWWSESGCLAPVAGREDGRDQHLMCCAWAPAREDSRPGSDCMLAVRLTPRLGTTHRSQSQHSPEWEHSWSQSPGSGWVWVMAPRVPG